VTAPTEDIRAQARRRARLFAPLFGALTALGGFTLDAYASGFPRMRNELHSSNAGIQLTLTACVIGLTLGQLVIGPLSDAYGRRRPLIIGLLAYVGLSIGCALVGGVDELIALRFVQGFGAAAGMVIARAIARDLFTGAALGRFYAQMVSITMIMPLISPVLGSQLLPLISWRGIFGVMAVIGVLLTVLTVKLIPETLVRPDPTVLAPSLLSGFGRLLARPRFVAFGLTLGLSFAAVFVYSASASFVLQDFYGLTPREYGGVTAATSLGIVLAGQVNIRLPERWPVLARARLCLTVSAVLTGCLVAVVGLGLSVVFVLACVFVVFLCHGITWPSVMALGMDTSDQDAGTASALLGAMQFGIGAAASPVTGFFPGNEAQVTVVLMFAFIATALAVLVWGTRHRSAAAAETAMESASADTAANS
jgi:DHA1 family bicyclomycin/chloramphenicol resistance-like MFS transporter